MGDIVGRKREKNLGDSKESSKKGEKSERKESQSLTDSRKGSFCEGNIISE